MSVVIALIQQGLKIKYATSFDVKSKETDAKSECDELSISPIKQNCRLYWLKVPSPIQ
jgi:hypothetical protein